MREQAHSAPSWADRKAQAGVGTSSAERAWGRELLETVSHNGCSSHAEPHLFVRVFGVDRWLGLFGPDSLVERFQKGALQQRQRILHFTSAESQRFLTLRNISEAESMKLLHLRAKESKE